MANCYFLCYVIFTDQFIVSLLDISIFPPKKSIAGLKLLNGSVYTMNI